MPYFEYAPYPVQIMRPMADEIWASIRLINVEEICLGQLKRKFHGRRDRLLRELAHQIRSCVTQAEEFFWIAQSASSRVAPLLHYYSMLNLAKALIFLKAPDRLSRKPHFYHGLTDPQRIKTPESFSLEKETIKVAPGIFSTLHYILTGEELVGSTSYKIMALLRYCTWITSELEGVSNQMCRLVHLSLKYAEDAGLKRVRIIAEVRRAEVLAHCQTLSAFKTDSKSFHSLFYRVASDDPDMLKYESQPVAYTTLATGRSAYRQLREAMRDVRLYRSGIFTGEDKAPEYLMPLNDGSTKPLPDTCVLLAVTFYLGSMVRYQPHIFDRLLGTEDAWLLEAFIRQCPLAYSQIMPNHLWEIEHLFQGR